jgi:hypothetical protein
MVRPEEQVQLEEPVVPVQLDKMVRPEEQVQLEEPVVPV